MRGGGAGESLRGLAFLLALALVGAAGPARAVDQGLAGRRLTVRQDAGSERLVLVARDAVVLPTPGESDDPTLGGARLHVGNPDTAEWAHLTLSAAGWWPAAPGVFRFRNPATTGIGSEVQSVLLREGRGIKVRATRLGITLDEPAQGRLAVVLATGARRWCAVFGGRVKKDAPGRFTARRSDAPSACPEPNPGAATSTTTPSSGTTSTSTSSSTTSTLAAPSTTTPSTSSTTSTTGFTCGGVFPLCSGTCEPGKTCGGLLCTCA